MPDDPTLLDNSNASATTNTHTSGSFTPTADALLVAFAGAGGATNEIVFDTISDTLTGTGTWTQHDRPSGQDSSNRWIEVTIWTAQAGASPGSGTVTVESQTNFRRIGLHIVEVTSFDTGSPVTQTKPGQNTSTSLTITFDAGVDADGLVMGVLAMDSDSALDAGSGFTPFAEEDLAGFSVQSQWDNTTPGDSVDWSNLATERNVGVIIEIADEGGAPAVTAYMTTNRGYWGT